MIRFRDDFPALLAGLTLETLEEDSSSIYGLSTDLAINYLNPAWFTFARDNGGEPGISERFTVGSYLGDAISGDAREFYLSALTKVLKERLVWRHVYECSTPDKYRAYHQSVYPLLNGMGLIVVNSLLVERPQRRRKHPATESLYTQDTGMINQCSNCRRIQRLAPADIWDWVPAWVEHVPANASHTFCPLCYDYYYLHRSLVQ